MVQNKLQVKIGTYSNGMWSPNKKPGDLQSFACTWTISFDGLSTLEGDEDDEVALFHRFLARFLMGSWHEWEIPLRRSTAWWQIPVLSFSSMRWKKTYPSAKRDGIFLGRRKANKSSQPRQPHLADERCHASDRRQHRQFDRWAVALSSPGEGKQWGDPFHGNDSMWDSKAVIYIYIYVCVSYVYGLYICIYTIS